MSKNIPQYIILHCSAGPDRVVRDWDAIRRYHKAAPPNGRGWRDIGYHYGIELVGDQYEVMVGRAEDESGAHCSEQGMNFKSLGVCLVGGDPMEGFGPKYPLPGAQRDKLVELCAGLCRRLKIPVANIHLHRDYNPKPCPGPGVTREDIQKRVADYIKLSHLAEPDTGKTPSPMMQELDAVLKSVESAYKDLVNWKLKWARIQN